MGLRALAGLFCFIAYKAHYVTQIVSIARSMLVTGLAGNVEFGAVVGIGVRHSRGRHFGAHQNCLPDSYQTTPQKSVDYCFGVAFSKVRGDKPVYYDFRIAIDRVAGRRRTRGKQ